MAPAASNGFLYYAAQGGQSGSGTPAWPTAIGQSVTDGGVIWTCIGKTIIQCKSADVTWTGLSVSFRYAVIWSQQTGSRPLVLIDYGSTQTLTAQNLTVSQPTLGWAWLGLG